MMAWASSRPISSPARPEPTARDPTPSCTAMGLRAGETAPPHKGAPWTLRGWFPRPAPLRWQDTGSPGQTLDGCPHQAGAAVPAVGGGGGVSRSWPILFQVPR